MSESNDFPSFGIVRPDLLGARCSVCRKRHSNWGACHTCADRPFGSAPCCDDGDENIDCGGCPNEMICAEINERETPLAQVAMGMANHWMRVDAWTVQCPGCGVITQYPDDVCDKCGKELLPADGKWGDG